MSPEQIVVLIPIAAIIMVGLVRISRHWGPGIQPQGSASKQLEERLEAVEQELASLHHDLTETQERLDFAERLLAQTREGKRIGPAE